MAVVSTTDIALLAAGGLALGEATGATNFTPFGAGGEQDQQLLAPVGRGLQGLGLGLGGGIASAFGQLGQGISGIQVPGFDLDTSGLSGLGQAFGQFGEGLGGAFAPQLPGLPQIGLPEINPQQVGKTVGGAAGQAGIGFVQGVGDAVFGPFTPEFSVPINELDPTRGIFDPYVPEPEVGASIDQTIGQAGASISGGLASAAGNVGNLFFPGVSSAAGAAFSASGLSGANTAGGDSTDEAAFNSSQDLQQTLFQDPQQTTRENLVLSSDTSGGGTKTKSSKDKQKGTSTDQERLERAQERAPEPSRSPGDVAGAFAL